MDDFIDSLTAYRYRKKIQQLMKQAAHKRGGYQNIAMYFEELYQNEEISWPEYIYLHARIHLNAFCAEAEQQFGRGAQTGFLFYSHKEQQLFYGAGDNYPDSLKRFLSGIRPTLCMISNEDYQDGLYVVPDAREWVNTPIVQPGYDKAILESGCRSLISYRLRMKGFTIGTFEVYFPEARAYTEEDFAWIRTHLPKKAEALFEAREEMVRALSTLPTSIIVPCRVASYVHAPV